MSMTKRERRALRVAENLRRIRLASGLTLLEVASRAGIQESHLSEMERGLRGRDTILRILDLTDALRCQPQDIFSTEEDG